MSLPIYVNDPAELNNVLGYWDRRNLQVDEANLNRQEQAARERDQWDKYYWEKADQQRAYNNQLATQQQAQALQEQQYWQQQAQSHQQHEFDKEKWLADQQYRKQNFDEQKSQFEQSNTLAQKAKTDQQAEQDRLNAFKSALNLESRGQNSDHYYKDYWPKFTAQEKAELTATRDAYAQNVLARAQKQAAKAGHVNLILDEKRDQLRAANRDPSYVLTHKDVTEALKAAGVKLDDDFLASTVYAAPGGISFYSIVMYEPVTGRRVAVMPDRVEEFLRKKYTLQPAASHGSSTP